jgi:hypothetical protein
LQNVDAMQSVRVEQMSPAAPVVTLQTPSVVPGAIRHTRSGAHATPDPHGSPSSGAAAHVPQLPLVMVHVPLRHCDHVASGDAISVHGAPEGSVPIDAATHARGYRVHSAVWSASMQARSGS